MPADHGHVVRSEWRGGACRRDRSRGFGRSDRRLSTLRLGDRRSPQWAGGPRQVAHHRRIGRTLAGRGASPPALFLLALSPDSALFPVIEQLGRAAGFARDDPPASKLEKLEALLAHAAPPDEDMGLAFSDFWGMVFERFGDLRMQLLPGMRATDR